MRIKISKLKSLISESVKDILQNDANNLKHIQKESDQKIGPSKGYRWKEVLMAAIQDSLSMQTNSIHSQEDFQKAIDMEIEKIRADMDQTLTMIGRALYQIPYNVFVTSKNKDKETTNQ